MVSSLATEFEKLVLAASVAKLASWPNDSRKLVIRKSRKDAAAGSAFYESSVEVKSDDSAEVAALFAFYKKNKKALAAAGCHIDMKVNPTPKFMAKMKMPSVASAATVPVVPEVVPEIVTPTVTVVHSDASTAPTEPLPKARKPRAKKEIKQPVEKPAPKPKAKRAPKAKKADEDISE